MIDDVSYRELGVLTVLAELESMYLLENEDGQDGQDMQEYRRAHRIWNPKLGNFEVVACNRLNLLPMEFRSLLSRLSRTGLYAPSFVLVTGYTGGRVGALTPMYYRLAGMIKTQGTEWMSKAEHDSTLGHDDGHSSGQASGAVGDRITC